MVVIFDLINMIMSFSHVVTMNEVSWVLMIHLVKNVKENNKNKYNSNNSSREMMMIQRVIVPTIV
ncbi:hypothetical protein D3C80_2140860 [compost metagenome]